MQAMCEKFPKLLPPPPTNEIGVPRAASHLARAPPLHSIRINMHSICRGKNHVREFRLADGRRGVDKQTQLLTVLPRPLRSITLAGRIGLLSNSVRILLNS